MIRLAFGVYFWLNSKPEVSADHHGRLGGRLVEHRGLKGFLVVVGIFTSLLSS